MGRGQKKKGKERKREKKEKFKNFKGGGLKAELNSNFICFNISLRDGTIRLLLPFWRNEYGKRNKAYSYL